MEMGGLDSQSQISSHLLAGGALTVIGLGLLLYLRMKGGETKQPIQEEVKDEENENKQKSEDQSKARKQVLESIHLPGNFPKDVYIYFGSQTGTAEKLCNNLEEELHELGVENTHVINFDEFSKETFPKHELCLVCVATHYEGDPCDNTLEFWKYLKELRKSGAKDTFKGMKFAIFGLGDTSYELFNEMGKEFDARFEELGGERLYELGAANAEFQTTEEDFEKWKENLWQTLGKHYESLAPADSIPKLKKKSTSIGGSSAKVPQLVCKIIETAEGYKHSDEPSYSIVTKQYLSTKRVKLDSIHQIRQNLDHGSTLEASFALKDSGLTYLTATNSAIFPENSREDVDYMTDRLKLDKSATIVFEKHPEYVKPGSVKHPFPTPCTIEDALYKFIDVRGAILKKTLKEIAELCDSTEEKNKLMTYVNDKEAYNRDIIGKNKCLIDLLKENESLNPTMEQLMLCAQTIMPRYYTIASSNLKYPDHVKVGVSLDYLKQEDGSKRMGLMSAHLQRMSDNFGKDDAHVHMFVKNSYFVMPEDSNTPYIMVGPGTGVVPFIGFMQERRILKEQQGKELSEAYMYFGCRYSESDYIYKEEMEQQLKDGIVSDLRLAFSREGKKQYVQDLLKEDKERVLDVMNRGGNFYICGSTKMGNDVQAMLKDWLGPEEYKKVDEQKRLIKELW